MVIEKGKTAARKKWAFAGLLMLLCLLSAASVRAEDIWQVKAAFIFNFTKFVNWPAELEQQGGQMNLCLYRDNPFGDHIYRLEGRKVRNFSLHVMQQDNQESLKDCQIIYLANAANAEKALVSIAGRPVLTIGDHESFTREGGNIRFLSESNRIRFDINLQRSREDGLGISSRLLQLARQVQ